MIKEIHVYDMDGTIVDSLHRYRTMPCGTRIDLQYLLDNEDKAMQDTLLPLASQYQEQLKNPEIYVIIATARVLNVPDHNFIQTVLGSPDKIISRAGRTDHRSGTALKAPPLKQLFSLKQFKNAKKWFYEDNKTYLDNVSKICDMTPIFVPSQQGH